MKENEDFEKDPLWDVLGKARPIEVSPVFARNVVRAVRLQEAAKAEREQSFHLKNMLGDLLGLFRSWRPALVGSVVGCIAIAFFSVMTATEDGRLLSLDFYHDLSADHEVIANLNELLAMEDSLVWLDSSQY